MRHNELQPHSDLNSDVTTLLCSPPAARPGSVLHHDPPAALPRQTPRAAVGARHLLHASAQVPGAAQPSTVLEEQRLLPAHVASSTPRLRKSSRLLFLFNLELKAIYAVSVQLAGGESEVPYVTVRSPDCRLHWVSNAKQHP